MLTAPGDLSGLGQRVLMFSGGRDSTLAALRMKDEGGQTNLVTVSSTHLVGLRRVKARLRELAPYLGADTPWYHIRQPTELRTDTSFYEQTCLPCHHAYVVVSGLVARSLNADRLAFGYAAYQGQWPEQTPLAISRLAEVLARHQITLELPVYDLKHKDLATAELKSRGVSVEALEQKCLRQVTNIALPEGLLRRQVDLWGHAIDQSLSQLNTIKLEIAEQRHLGEFV